MSSGSEKKCKVCIIGGGTAGMAAAYALLAGNIKDVILIEREKSLGGTATNAWVEYWIEGINPPYLVKLFEELKQNGKACGDFENSWLPKKFLKPSAYVEKKFIDQYQNSPQLIFNPDALADKYMEDMKKAKFEILTQTVLAKAESDEGRVKSIKIRNTVTNDEYVVRADFFIDSSADGILCRMVNDKKDEDYFYGEDPRGKYDESLAPLSGADPTIVNEPSLFYEVLIREDDSDLLESVKAVRLEAGKETVKPDYIKNDGYVQKSPYVTCVNPMTGMGLSGYECMNDYQKTYEKAQCRRFEHWKYVKSELNRLFYSGIKDGFGGYKFSQKGYICTSRFAPMLGVRESYRIQCERMLVENDLTQTINPQNLQSYISCGSHDVDLHIKGHINPQELKLFNEKKLRPSGVPYECMIPKKMKNVLIACRAFGASHIALAARRTNKDMAQLGWAAGHAIRICVDTGAVDVRLNAKDIHILQSDEYTAFRKNATLIFEKMKDGL